MGGKTSKKHGTVTMEQTVSRTCAPQRNLGEQSTVAVGREFGGGGAGFGAPDKTNYGMIALRWPRSLDKNYFDCLLKSLCSTLPSPSPSSPVAAADSADTVGYGTVRYGS